MTLHQFYNIGILIPAFNPDDKLIYLLDDIHQQTKFNQKIVIVDDGSVNQDIFEQITTKYGQSVVVLHHDSNQGKGQALKTGFQYFLQHYQFINGVATIDADGQHKVSDLRNLEDNFIKHPEALIIGGRTFDEAVPLRSRLGNLVTNQLVKVLTGIRVRDTQTGLRIIPINYVKLLISFPTNHYEFEFDMLLATKKAGIELVEVPIQTVYLDNNVTSHFRVIHDSLAIYSRFFKYAFSGVSSFVIDIVSFYVLVHFMMTYTHDFIIWATLISRVISGLCNYVMNKRLVFGTQTRQALWKYSGLFLCQLVASGLLTTIFSYLTALNQATFWISCIKIMVDLGLFLISYQIQKRFVFREAKDTNAA